MALCELFWRLSGSYDKTCSYDIRRHRQIYGAAGQEKLDFGCYTMHRTAKLEQRKGYARARSRLGARAFRP